MILKVGTSGQGGDWILTTPQAQSSKCGKKGIKMFTRKHRTSSSCLVFLKTQENINHKRKLICAKIKISMLQKSYFTSEISHRLEESISTYTADNVIYRIYTQAYKSMRSPNRKHLEGNEEARANYQHLTNIRMDAQCQ